eukprot:TRINITY_DN6629_c0_g1_i1.p1 TRINITY_DN6629_c0_g1~~TRINITY_DN6629_c0_g1_i1.p1  ORF type:complete len:216 (-),score=51.52 TRINITY_DN6629_c0_g1_i1:92-739(-)
MVVRVAAVHGAMRAQRRRRAADSQDAYYKATPSDHAASARHKAAEKEAKRRAAIDKLFEKYDADSSGGLERPDIIRLLTDMDSSTPPGTEPTTEEVDWVIKTADKQGDGCIDKNELKEALTCWATWMQKRSEIEEAFVKFDTSNSGTLNREEVRKYLIHLNDGGPVSDAEVDMIMTEADVDQTGELDNKIELMRATANWYGHVEKKPKSTTCAIL